MMIVRTAPDAARAQREDAENPHEDSGDARARQDRVVLLIVVVLIVNGCLKSQQKQSLETYNRDASRIAQESEQQVSKPFFSAPSS